MRSNIIFTTLMATVIVLGSHTAKSQSGTSANVAVQAVKTVKLNENLTSLKGVTTPRRFNAKFEGMYDLLYGGTFEGLPDSTVTHLRNLEVSFCGDTITINGIKGTYKRYTVATKNIFLQDELYQRFVYGYFGKKGINLKDSVDKLLVEYIYKSDWNEKRLSYYKRPGIIYERPYLLIPYRSNYCVSFIVDIESSEFNRLMPERRDQRIK